MVKRPKSPPIEEDTRLFTVYQPYPLNANFEIEDNLKECALWIAEIIGNRHHIVIYHKPKSRGMILLEIPKEFTDHGRLLGEHRWGEFLKNPTDEERDRYTQVFHSFYSKVRDAQKDGWLEEPAKTSWYKGWAPGVGLIAQPYHPTHWCQVPIEDKTNKTLCRPLPVEKKPPPPRAPPPVVGSTQWVEKQVVASPASTADRIPPLNIAKANQGPPPSATVRSPNAISAQTSNTGVPYHVNGSYKAKLMYVTSSFIPSAPTREDIRTDTEVPVLGHAGLWQKDLSRLSSGSKPVPLQKFNSAERTASKGGKAAWGGQNLQKSASASGAKSPLAEPAPAGPVNAWAKQLKIAPEKPSKQYPAGESPFDRPVDLFGEPSLDAWFEPPSSKGRGSSSPGSNNSPWGTRPPSPGKVQTAPQQPTQEQASQGSKSKRKKNKGKTTAESPEPQPGPPQPAVREPVFVEVPGGLPELEGFDDEENLEDLEISALHPWEAAESTSGDQTTPEEPKTALEDGGGEDQWANLWQDEDGGRKKAPELICPTHKIACRKGICRDMDKLVKSKAREKAEADRAAGGRGARRGNWRDRGHNRRNSNTRSTEDNNNNRANGNQPGEDKDGYVIVAGRSGRGGQRGRRGGAGGNQLEGEPFYHQMRGFNNGDTADD
ncbi:hypothetical protein NLJ89_g6901 [Agrocybe chaxingu]|uniref:Uncharacterized protein n=1 Tax=Agrocybe chaxingu TaxID=84603 RepID=A0A9W8JYB0_9AGAR|nr:hypothetical protein NLJ89_g6901 [Agrocybe chaxingu]